MDINITEPLPHQVVVLNELQNLLVFRPRYQGKKLYERKDFSSVPNIAAGKLADNEWVAHHFSIIQEPFKVGLALPKMTHPYRSVYENHCHHSAVLLRGMAFNCLSVPPSFDSRLALSFAINASRPSLTRVVFSLMPVNSDALSTRVSSMFKVVLMVMHLSSQ